MAGVVHKTWIVTLPHLCHKGSFLPTQFLIAQCTKYRLFLWERYAPLFGTAALTGLAKFSPGGEITRYAKAPLCYRAPMLAPVLALMTSNFASLRLKRTPVIPCSEIIQARFGIALFARKLPAGSRILRRFNS
jgi:hypothetical protein